MELNQIHIGDRIRNLRENTLHESRECFAGRCGIAERYMGQIERGELIINLTALTKIVTVTGVSSDYILYGKNNNKRLQIITNLHYIIDTSDLDELKIYYKNICNFRSYLYKNRMFG